MELSRAYREIEKRLQKIDFHSLYRGFSRFPFAVYNDTQACIDGKTVDKPGEFIANTAVKYNGMDTAIWYLIEESYDFDVLTSKIVHEMLHAYQNASGEKRWPDERAAMVKYRYEAANIGARLEEAACMRKCLEEEDPAAFARLLGLRKTRMERFPYEYDYEARIEQIEGSAHYVENAALAQLDPTKAAQGQERMFKDLANPVKYLPVRAVTYESGAAFIACLRKYTDLDTDAFTDMPFAIAAVAQAVPCEIPEDDGRTAACIDEWRMGIRKVVAQALEKGNVVLEGPCRLAAWNVYDSVWDGQYAIITYFIGYIEGDELPNTDEEFLAQMKMLNGDFVVEVGEDLIMKRVWKR